MTGRTAARWAWGIAAATLASQILVVWVVAANRAALPAHVVEALPILGSGLVIITAFPVLAAVILRRYPRHPIGWIMCGAAATAVLDGVARSYAIAGLYLAPGSVPAAEVAAWSSDWIWLPAVALLLLYVPLLFPDGRLPSPRWRPVAVVGAWWIVLATLGYAFVPEPLTDFPDVDKPFQVPAASALASLMLLIPVAVGVSLAAVLVRRRRSQGDEREQLRWLTWAVGVALPLWTLSMSSASWGSASGGSARPR
jgi:two-component system NarL family sensor kinase